MSLHCKASCSRPPAPLQPSYRLAEAGTVDRIERRDEIVDVKWCDAYARRHGPRRINLVMLVALAYFTAALESEVTA